MRPDPDFAEPIVAKDDGPWGDEALMRLWFWACVVNAIVPFLIGAGATAGEARGGMLLGVVAIVGVGGGRPGLARGRLHGGLWRLGRRLGPNLPRTSTDRWRGRPRHGRRA